MKTIKTKIQNDTQTKLNTPITLILPGTVRSKKNSREKHYTKTKTGKLIQFSAASSSYRAWEMRAQQSARQQLANYGIMNPTDQQIKLTIRAYVKGPAPDLDAVHTAVMDCLEGIAWTNDKQIQRFSENSFIRGDKKYPRTEVMFERLEDKEC